MRSVCGNRRSRRGPHGRAPSVPATTTGHCAHREAPLEKESPSFDHCATSKYSPAATAIGPDGLPAPGVAMTLRLDDLVARDPDWSRVALVPLRSLRTCRDQQGPVERGSGPRGEVDDLQRVVLHLLRGDRAGAKMHLADAVRWQGLSDGRHARAAKGHEESAAGEYESRRGAANVVTHGSPPLEIDCLQSSTSLFQCS